ncbi:saccharopine dehydrogenase-like oxidoreductase, partial [Eurytemora carolleeae]|uniref:saccharopine dehydrogenase-like oxidoreductase n=1 Tax=Eurytemora carolleeae TaxID=1294199 RepID=UPI000C7845CD
KTSVHRAAVQHGISWAVAGRNEARLQQVLSAAGRAVSADLSSVPVLLCDCGDSNSLIQMARRSRVLLNCVGPYRFFGEAVVEACVEAGAHHVDISGEPAFLEKMQLKYHQKAVENGVYVVGSCGFDSIPSDLGQICVRKEMKGDLNSVETFLSVSIPPLPGAALNFGTWQSAIYGFAYAQGLGKMFYAPEVDSYCMPFLGADRSVMLRTQREIYHGKEENPAQVQCYVEMSRLNIILTMLVGIVFGILASFKFGRSLLENYPGFFSLGAVSKQGVPKAKADETNFTMTLLGKGWDYKGDHDSPPNRVVKTIVKGKNVGYGATCECLVQAGLVILQEMDRLPSVGGVYTPGFAFAETTLVDRLHKHGVTFDTTILN